MIYFDNAATTRKKPQEVLDAFTYYLTEVGTSPGRGSYSLGIQASRMLFQSRKAVCGFLAARPLQMWYLQRILRRQLTCWSADYWSREIMC